MFHVGRPFRGVIGPRCLATLKGPFSRHTQRKWRPCSAPRAHGSFDVAHCAWSRTPLVLLCFAGLHAGPRRGCRPAYKAHRHGGFAPSGFELALHHHALRFLRCRWLRDELMDLLVLLVCPSRSLEVSRHHFPCRSVCHRRRFRAQRWSPRATDPPHGRSPRSDPTLTLSSTSSFGTPCCQV